MQKYCILIFGIIYSSISVGEGVLDSEKKVAITLSPFHSLISVWEFNAEIRTQDNLGVSAIFGSGDSSLGNQGETYSILEYGLQANYYPNANFSSGLHYGIEILKIEVEHNTFSNIESSAEGVSIGPYIGYKALYENGFTFVSQIGYQQYSIIAEASDNSGSSASIDAQGSGLLLNLNAGFSF